MPTFKALITPTVSGGNIEVKISANNANQARELIKTLSYFKSFVKMPTKVSEKIKLSSDKLDELAELQYSKDGLDIKKLIELDNVIMFDFNDAIYYNRPVE